MSATGKWHVGKLMCWGTREGFKCGIAQLFLEYKYGSGQTRIIAWIHMYRQMNTHTWSTAMPANVFVDVECLMRPVPYRVINATEILVALPLALVVR